LLAQDNSKPNPYRTIENWAGWIEMQDRIVRAAALREIGQAVNGTGWKAPPEMEKHRMPRFRPGLYQ
jgi:hypothetical protein